MTQCEYCGNTYDRNDKYCPTCGAKLNHPERPKEPDPPKRPAAPPPPAYRPPEPEPVKQGVNPGVFVVGGFMVVVLLLVGLGTFSGNSRRVSGMSVTMSDGSSVRDVYEGPDPALYDDMFTRLQTDSSDKEAMLYMVWYYLYTGDIVHARQVAEAFVEQGIKDDGDIYISLANDFGARQPQVAYWVLQQGYELTGQAAVQEVLWEYQQVSSFITDSSLLKAIELMFGKSSANITFDDILSVRFLRISDGGMCISYSMEAPQLVNGRIQDEAAYLQDISLVMLDSPIRDYSELRIFDHATAICFDETSVEIASLGDLYNMEYMSIASGRRDAEIKELPYLPRLRGLYLSGQNVISLVGLGDLEALEHLGLNRTEVVDLSSVTSLPNLVSLTLVRNENMGNLDPVAQLTGLRELSIENYDVVQLAMAAEMPDLEVLSIVNTKIKSVDFLPGLTNLTYLELRGNDNLLDVPALDSLVNLEELSLDCSQFSDRSNLNFATSLPGLRKASLLKCGDLSPLRAMSNLEELRVTFWSLDDFSPLSSVPGLKRLTITTSSNSGVTSSGIANLSSIGSLSNLEYLNLNGAGFYAQGDAIFNLPNLKYLGLNQNTFVGNFAGVSNLTNLEELHLDKTKFTANAYEEYDGFFHNLYTSGSIEMSTYLDSIGKLHSLEVLSIQSNKLDSLEFAKDLSSLKFLYAAGNYISSVAPLAGLEHLFYVDLTDNPVSDWPQIEAKGDLIILGR